MPGRFFLKLPCESYTKRVTQMGSEYLLIRNGREAVRVTVEVIPDEGNKPKSDVSKAIPKAM
jgi:hypothetical protein